VISTIASAYEASADLRPAEPHAAWRSAWQRLREDYRSGRPIRLIDLAGYLPDVPIDDQRECACDLIAEHLRLYSRAGAPPLEDYVAALGMAFPSLLNMASLPADLIEDEFVIRSTPPRGDYPRLANYFARFPNRPDVYKRLARRCLASQRYVKLRVLGAGALGVLYEAYDSVMHQLVAVKEAAPHDPESAQRLQSEMRLFAELNHSGIVAVRDYGAPAHGPFYVMELIAGQPLSNLIGDYHCGHSARSAAENRRQLRLLIECVIQICDAVAHAHERGILHRDLKPGNVIVRDTGQAVIVDWGLARRIEPQISIAAELEVAGMIAGTPQYMAPEQVERQETQASDIFSLGATLYEALTGHPPYDWRGYFLPADWQTAVCGARIAPPRRFEPGIPRSLETICMKALSRSPADRYSTAGHLATALRQHLETQENACGWWTSFFSTALRAVF